MLNALTVIKIEPSFIVKEVHCNGHEILGAIKCKSTYFGSHLSGESDPCMVIRI